MFKLVMKYFFDPKFQLAANILKAVVAAIEALLHKSSNEAILVKKAMDSIYPVLPSEFKDTATQPEIEECIIAARDFFLKIQKLYT